MEGFPPWETVGPGRGTNHLRPVQKQLSSKRNAKHIDSLTLAVPVLRILCSGALWWDLQVSPVLWPLTGALVPVAALYLEAGALRYFPQPISAGPLAREQKDLFDCDYLIDRQNRAGPGKSSLIQWALLCQAPCWVLSTVRSFHWMQQSREVGITIPVLQGDESSVLSWIELETDGILRGFHWKEFKEWTAYRGMNWVKGTNKQWWSHEGLATACSHYHP